MKWCDFNLIYSTSAHMPLSERKSSSHLQSHWTSCKYSMTMCSCDDLPIEHQAQAPFKVHTRLETTDIKRANHMFCCSKSDVDGSNMCVCFICSWHQSWWCFGHCLFGSILSKRPILKLVNLPSSPTNPTNQQIPCGSWEDPFYVP